MTDRRLLLTAAPLGLAATLPGLALAHANDKKADEEDVGATEDLMREHGVLNRVLLVYEEGLRRLRAKEDIPPEVFRAIATLVRKFVEDYHEKLEGNFIFPAFEKKNTLTDLVKVLKQQHDAGRKLTDVILREAADDSFKKEDGRTAVVGLAGDEAESRCAGAWPCAARGSRDHRVGGVAPGGDEHGIAGAGEAARRVSGLRSVATSANRPTPHLYAAWVR